jgi:hypothetical protein
MVVVYSQVYNIKGNAESLKLLFFILKGRFSVIICISSMDVFIMKIIENVEISVIV